MTQRFATTQTAKEKKYAIVQNAVFWLFLTRSCAPRGQGSAKQGLKTIVSITFYYTQGMLDLTGDIEQNASQTTLFPTN